MSKRKDVVAVKEQEQDKSTIKPSASDKEKHTEAKVDDKATDKSSPSVTVEAPRMTSNALPLILFVAVLGILAAIFVPGMLKPAYRELHVSDEKAMKEVLFSGQPWLVYCAIGSRNNRYGETEYLVPPALETMIKHVGSVPNLNLGVVDCMETFKSGKTLMERFELDLPENRSRPLGFYTANNFKPRSIPERFAKPSVARKEETIEKFAKFLTRETNSRMFQVLGEKDLINHCFARDNCVIVVTKTKDQASLVAAAVKKFRFITFAIFDASRLALDFSSISDEAQLALSDFDEKIPENRSEYLPGFKDQDSTSFPKLISIRTTKAMTEKGKKYSVTMSSMKYPAFSLAPWTVDSFLTQTFGSPQYGAESVKQAQETWAEMYPNTEAYAKPSVKFLGVPKIVSPVTKYQPSTIANKSPVSASVDEDEIELD